jgi:hypothetical protein
VRLDDLQLHRDALRGPAFPDRRHPFLLAELHVGDARFELATFGSGDQCSIQLS